MSDLSILATALPVGGIGAVAGFAGKAAMEWLKTKGARSAARVTADVQLEEHRDKLMLDLLATSRTEAAAATEQAKAARAEAAALRPLETKLAQFEARMVHFDEALEHLQAMLMAPPGEERVAADRRARAFLNRMRRLGDAQGTLLNEAQREASAAALAREAQGQIDSTDWKD